MVIPDFDHENLGKRCSTPKYALKGTLREGGGGGLVLVENLFNTILFCMVANFKGTYFRALLLTLLTF